MESGAPLRQHLLAAWKATGEKPQALDTPPAPDGQRHLLAWFHDLAAGRSMGYAQPCPITWAEMAAWQQMQGLPLEPWEAQVLRRLDQLWLRAWDDGREKH
jgi:hypothetical protein